MGKKVDLNKPNTNGGNLRKNNHSNSHLNYSTPTNNESQSQVNPVKQKVAEAGLRSVGVPKGIASAITKNEKTWELAEKGVFSIKMPLPMKITVYGFLFGIPIIGLMLFVVLFGNEASAASYGSFAYGKTCTSVTVNNTGCDNNAENCSHIYDGQVELNDYIAGVVAAEVGIVNNLEYYKVAAIAARTYFLNHITDDCTVNGNTTFQAYKDVDDSSYASLIRQAVEETDGLVMVENGELIGAYYASACVVNADDEYYYVRYGTKSLGEANFQKIPKEWDQNTSVFKGYLASWYAKTDPSNTDYDNKACPSNHDYGMSQIGALYLITGENYSYEEVIEYYYGPNVEIVTNEMQLAGVEGFVNPTRYIKCTSAFGYRIHPVTGKTKFHTGLDIGIPGGEPIYAAQNGTVTKVVNNVSAINNCDYGYGNYIIISHENGLSTVYAHIKYGTIPSSIYAGITVSQGEQIGEVGSTGCSTGNHLHYEVRLNNEQVDPADYLDLTGATGTCRR